MDQIPVRVATAHEPASYRVCVTAPRSANYVVWHPIGRCLVHVRGQAVRLRIYIKIVRPVPQLITAAAKKCGRPKIKTGLLFAVNAQSSLIQVKKRQTNRQLSCREVTLGLEGFKNFESKN